VTISRHRRIADFANRLLTRFGYTILPNWRIENWGLAAHLHKIFTNFDVDCVLDVGANNGGYARFLRHEVGYDGLILSFEPIAQMVDECRRLGSSDPRWQVFPYALGSENCEKEINVAAYPQFSSFLQQADSVPSAFENLIRTTSQQRVEVRRLDEILPDLIAQFDYRRPYLKIDTQGFDLAVIEGAGHFLRTMVAAQTELSFRPIYNSMPSWRTVLNTLEASHFSISNMFAINADPAMRAIEFDCVLVNDRIADG